MKAFYFFVPTTLDVIMSQQRKSSVTSLPPLSSSNLLSASLKQYLKRRGSLGQDSKKAKWATLTDRTLSPDERKRLAKAAAQKLFASKSQHNHRCSRPSISSSKTLKSQNHRLTRSSSSTSKELSKDFLTLVCYNAVATGQLGLLKTLHTSGKIPLVDKQGNTPLHIAAKFGQLRCLRWLLQSCCIPLLAKNVRGETCVHVAALHGNLKCLQTILSEPDSTAGAFAAAVERDNAGLTCLHYATMGNRDATVFWLVAKFGKELCLIRSMDGVLAIHFATASGNKECTEVLVKACKKSVNLKDVFGATPVYYAAQEGQLEVLQFLVEQAEGSLDLVACEGMTPLLTAVEGGHLGVVKYILEKQGRGALFATTHDGATVYHYAAGNGKTEILRFLLEAPERRELLFITDMNEKTPAHDAAEQGHVDCLQLLLEHRLSLYLPDRNGDTPLTIALRSARPQCVLFARALVDATLEVCNSKSLKKSIGSKLLMSKTIIARSHVREQSASPVHHGGMFDCKVFPFFCLRSRKKMGQQESTFVNPKDSGGGIETQGPIVWPSWQQSLTPRGMSRPSGLGIFRGEFILLRSSMQRDIVGWKESLPNSHLYAQRHRPCPVSLPLGRPDEFDVHDQRDKMLSRSFDKCTFQQTTMNASRKTSGPRDVNIDQTLHGIREEQENDLSPFSEYKTYEANSSISPVYICRCGRHPEKVSFQEPKTYSDIQVGYSTLGRRTSKYGREIMKSSKIVLPPVKEDTRERPTTPEQDYSSEESGISDHDEDSDLENKDHYISSEDEEHHFKHKSCASSDSAMRDSDNFSSLSSDGDGHYLRTGDKDDDANFQGKINIGNIEINSEQIDATVVAEADVRIGECCSHFSSHNEDGEDSSSFSVSADSTFQLGSQLSHCGSPVVRQSVPRMRSRSVSPAKGRTGSAEQDCTFQAEKRPSSVASDDYHLYSEISVSTQISQFDNDDGKAVEPNFSLVSDVPTNIVPKLTTPTPPAPPLPLIPVPPAPPLHTISHPTSLNISPIESSITSPISISRRSSLSNYSNVRTLADVLHRSISDGMFSRHNTLRRHEPISLVFHNDFHTVDPSSLNAGASNSAWKQTDKSESHRALNKVPQTCEDSLSNRSLDSQDIDVKQCGIMCRHTPPLTATSTNTLGVATLGKNGEVIKGEKDEILSPLSVNNKCGEKIRALQNILIKQALPFANPSFVTNSSPVNPDRPQGRKTHVPESSPVPVKNTVLTDSISPPSQRSHKESCTSTMSITQKTECLKEFFPVSTLPPSHYARVSRLEKHHDDQSVGESLSRITSIKEKLQIVVPARVSQAQGLTSTPNHS